MASLYRDGEQLIIKNPGANIDAELGKAFEKYIDPAVQKGQQQSQQPKIKTPEDISRNFGPGRGNTADNANLRRQAETVPLYDRNRIEQQLDEITTDKPLDNATRQIIRRTGLKPSDFFIKQMKLHGVPLKPEIQQRLRTLDGSDLVSQALPASGEGSGGMGLILPNVSKAQRLWDVFNSGTPAARNAPVAPGGAVTPSNINVTPGVKGKKESIALAAQQLGIDPVDLAAVMSLETGGSYSTTITGGAGNNYQGLIQFGPTERRTYGYDERQSFEQQVLGPVVKYLKDRGVKPGHGAKEIYAAILTGNVANLARGGIDWKDANGTSVRGALPSLTSGQHRQNAIRFLQRN